jgi:predicted permease
VLIAAIFNIIFNMLAFGPGAMALEQTGESSHKGAPLSQRAKNMARALVSPSMIASYLAVVLTLLHVTDEGIIGQTCNMLGAATAPCAMLIVGSSLGKMRVKDMITDGWAWVTAFLRLIAVPVITFALFSLVIPDQHQLIAILTILAAMPAAANSSAAMASAVWMQPSLIGLPLIMSTFMSVPLLVGPMPWRYCTTHSRVCAPRNSSILSANVWRPQLRPAYGQPRRSASNSVHKSPS